ncbi:MAG: hypothetical protein WB779_10490 [Ignavibacteriaceae bacterium]
MNQTRGHMTFLVKDYDEAISYFTQNLTSFCSVKVVVFKYLYGDK